MQNCIPELTVAIRKLARYNFQRTDQVFSSVAKRMYDWILVRSTIYVDYHGANVIHLIKSNRCYF